VQSKLERATPVLIAVLICLTAYLCCREICKASLACKAIEKGIITGGKK
jgi:hypothetical protein